MDSGLQRRAKQRASELGISFAEYVRRAVAGDLGGARQKPDVSILFDLVRDGPPSDVARDKDRMLADAVLEDYHGKVDAKPQRKLRLAPRPRKR